MSFGIICNARAGDSLGIDVLALVDRAKSKRFWWTSDNHGIAINYRSLEAAQFACRRLKKNAPRVVPFESVVKALNKQSNQIINAEALADVEQGWDAHKDWGTS